MLVIRPVRKEDLNQVFALSKKAKGGITTLPQDKGILKKSITTSIHSFNKNAKQPGSEMYFFVLEDNLRCPSGVSYMLENREIIKQAFPSLFANLGVQPVSDYCGSLLSMLQYLSPEVPPEVAVLTPGIYNSAYFEHSYIAQQMGVELVTGQDLIVENDRVFMQTTKGLQPVHVIWFSLRKIMSCLFESYFVYLRINYKDADRFYN